MSISRCSIYRVHCLVAQAHFVVPLCLPVDARNKADLNRLGVGDLVI